MEIKLSKDDFLKAIGKVMGAVNARATIPVLGNILFQTSGKDQVVLTGTDLEIGIRTVCAAKVTEEGSITLPAKKIHDIIRELPSGEVEVIVAKNNAVNIKAKKSFFKIMGVGPEDFPKFPDFDSASRVMLDESTLKQSLELTAFAISHDETRYTLNGVLLSLKEGKVRFVATDGKRLAYMERAVKSASDMEVIIPTKTIFELTKNMTGEGGEVGIVKESNQIVFMLKDTTIISRLIEGKFPNYEQVIPKGEKTTTEVSREEFLQATKRASILTSQENQSVKLDFIQGKVLISSRSPNLGEAKEEIEAHVTGDDLSIGFNPHYLIDVLKNLDIEKVSLSMTDPDKPGLIKGENGYLYVVMPMQLN